ncbi:hypothetical protein H4Q26_000764 [Puccinia striiformis f. sp. tritici PST-130]|nr:hypothetical protein H4Q26_000764 [Puccinia striiformis f. sp. tritici PST-130]
MTSQALSILSEAMIASNFTHPAMFSGDFEILEQSVAVPNRPGWGAAPQDLRNRIRISGNAYTAGRVLGDPSQMVNDTSDNGGSRLEVIVEFNGYDKQLQRPRQQDNQVPFLLKCVILSEPHLEGTQKLYRTERMIDEVSLPNGYQGSPNRLDLGNPVASSMHTWASQQPQADDDELNEAEENGHSPPPVLTDPSDSDCESSIDEKPRLNLRN